MLSLPAGNCFAFAANRAVHLPPTDTLADHVKAAKQQEQQRQLLAFEISYGEIQGDEGTTWLIQHSTLPGHVGQPLLPADMTPNKLEVLASSGESLNIGAFCPEGGYRLNVA